MSIAIQLHQKRKKLDDAANIDEHFNPKIPRLIELLVL
jgi:hypothetical protein